MALFGIPSSAHQPAYYFPTLPVDFYCICPNCSCNCLTDWGREPLSVQHTSLSSQRVKCSDGRPLAPGLPTHLWWDLLQWDTTKEHLPTCWELWEAKEPPSSMVPLESEAWIGLWHVPLETWTTLEELMQMEEECNSPENSMAGWTYSTPKHLYVMVFPDCNKADID